MVLTSGPYRMDCYLPKGETAQNIVYLHTAGAEAEEIWNLSAQNFVLAAIQGLDWNRDLSPWYHEKVFAGGEEFAGGADAYLSVLLHQLIPTTEQQLGILPHKRYLAGYSLSGLFALYAMYHTSIFDGIASVSGSLWYDGFGDYVENHTVLKKPDRIYFSLGKKEAASARGSMQTVLLCTQQIERKFRNDGIKTVLEWNEGGHFTQVPARIAKGIDWLL